MKITSNPFAINGNKNLPADEGPYRQTGSYPLRTNCGSVHSHTLAALLDRLESSLVIYGVFDTSKVDDMKQAVEDGSYIVDSAAIADKLIQGAQELVGRKA